MATITLIFLTYLQWRYFTSLVMINKTKKGFNIFRANLTVVINFYVGFL